MSMRFCICVSMLLRWFANDNFGSNVIPKNLGLFD
jgi:hypothetical protein